MASPKSGQTNGTDNSKKYRYQKQQRKKGFVQKETADKINEIKFRTSKNKQDPLEYS